MSYRTYTLPTLTAVGTVSGSALGTVTSYETIAGEIRGVYLAYTGTVATTDVVLSGAQFGGTILAVSDSVANGWYYPSVALNDGTAGTLAAYSGVPFVDRLKVVLSQGSAGDTLNTTVLVEF